VIDISRTITAGAPVFPGDPPLRIESHSRIASGAACNMLRLECTNHILTHLDAPNHFFDGGATLDELPLARFAGPALVIDSPSREIPPEALPADPAGLNVLFRTGREDGYLSPAAAAALASRGANLAGIDSLSVDPLDSQDFAAHRTLLGNGVLILEGLDLAGVAPGRYTLIALPLKIERADGSPVRAVLFADDEIPARQRPLAPDLVRR
jgi:arylformamidase